MDSRWKILTSIEQLTDVIDSSTIKPVLIFKHSTRCSISSMALNRLKNLSEVFYQSADFYYLDLIAHRDVSNAIAEKLDVFHESPQVVLVKNRVCTYDASHMEISSNDIQSQIQ